MLRWYVILISLVLAVFTASAEFLIVLDPGHGGKDAGALGDNTNEKTINLAVAQRLKNLILHDIKDAKVVMTRSDDNFVELQGRADMANRRKADLFISIHANSVDKKNPRRATVHGASVYTLGLNRANTNLEVAMRENSVIKMEKDYTTTYAGFDPQSAESYIMFDLMQHANLNSSISLAQEVQKELCTTAERANSGVKQAPFWVLVRTSMPAILVELDFICNPESERFMSSAIGQERLALAICNGIRKYRGDKNVKPSKPIPKQEKATTDEAKEDKKIEPTEPKAQDRSDEKLVYKIQFLSSAEGLNKKDRRIKGFENVSHYLDNGMLKYTTGFFEKQEDAQKELKNVRKQYPDAFIIKMRGDKRVK